MNSNQRTTYLGIREKIRQMEPGTHLDVFLSDIEAGIYRSPYTSTAGNYVAAFRALVSNQSHNKESRKRGVKYACRIKDDVLRVYCYDQTTADRIPDFSPGKPRKYDFETAEPGDEFFFPAPAMEHKKMRNSIHSSAYRQNVRVSMRSVRVPEHGLRVRVTENRNFGELSIPGFQADPEDHPFCNVSEGDRHFYPIEPTTDRVLALERCDELLSDLSKEWRRLSRMGRTPKGLDAQKWMHPYGELTDLYHRGHEPLPADTQVGVMVEFVDPVRNVAPPIDPRLYQKAHRVNASRARTQYDFHGAPTGAQFFFIGKHTKSKIPSRLYNAARRAGVKIRIEKGKKEGATGFRVTVVEGTDPPPEITDLLE